MSKDISLIEPQIKILLVDDREDNLMSMEVILQGMGYIIKKATSGRAALKILLNEYDFTLILMDVQMPELNGFETAEMIYERDKLKHIPIIFITANDYGEENVFRGYQTGGVDYIYKPFNPELLKAKVSVFVALFNSNHRLMAQEQQLIKANRSLAVEIEERKHSEEKIKELNNQLVENINSLKSINEELEQFAHVASHDLQEPLRKIIIFGERLESRFSGVLNDEGRDYLQRMTRAAGRMKELVRNILSYSKQSSLISPFEETNIKSLIEEVLVDIQMYVEQKKATVILKDLPTLKIIPGQFTQLIQNLILNALKFSKPGVLPEISIYAEKKKGNGIPGLKSERLDNEFYCVSVADNGIGFEQQYAEQIFMIFKRLHSFNLFEGTGIGLSICKKIAEQHKGTIYATGNPGIGSTFTVAIPVNNA